MPRKTQRVFLPKPVTAIAGALLLLSASLCLAYKAEAPSGVDLTGYWRLNTALSDDPEKLLQQRIEEQRKERERYMRKQRDELGIPPPDAAGPPPAPESGDVEGSPPPPQRQRPRNRHLDEMRRMLDISDTLAIRQTTGRVDVSSEQNSNSFEPGAKSQISMPQGELADQRVGWDGPWFVIERRASKGPRMVLKLRWLKKSDQLESVMAWSGDSPLAGIKVHRIYDRMAAPPAPASPDNGPVR